MHTKKALLNEDNKMIDPTLLLVYKNGGDRA